MFLPLEKKTLWAVCPSGGLLPSNNEMRTILNDGTPINEDEENAHEDMKTLVDFVDENMELITNKNNNYSIVFYTDHDF